jgi:hypothetical protein
MIIKVSYLLNGNLDFLRYMDCPNIEVARKQFRFSQVDSFIKPSKVSLVFEYQELIDAKILNIRGNYNKRMILFMKLCPNFKVVRPPYNSCGVFKERYQQEYNGEVIKINLQASKEYYDGSYCFDIKLK